MASNLSEISIVCCGYFKRGYDWPCMATSESNSKNTQCNTLLLNYPAVAEIA